MHITHTYIYSVIIQNKGYTPGLAFDRRIVSYVSRRWLWGSLLYENLLLVLFGHLLVFLLFGGHELHQLVLYMHATMMQHLVFWQQELLK